MHEPIMKNRKMKGRKGETAVGSIHGKSNVHINMHMSASYPAKKGATASSTGASFLQ